MPVYVDDVRIPYGRMLMCHMWADTREELHAMADRIGVRRKWFQRPPKASWEHYDICLTKRAQTVRYGAIVTDKYGPSEFVAKQKGDQKMLDRIAHLRARFETPLLL
ncbi:DUF4031 domain-containing protein [Microvirga sp. RSM25]|uniref:DUF4031 domain-containing protein n=1 Tax=Microvirga sp. RSM25 TaxID=3273802 RepID=UPI00384FFD8C